MEWGCQPHHRFRQARQPATRQRSGQCGGQDPGQVPRAERRRWSATAPHAQHRRRGPSTGSSAPARSQQSGRGVRQGSTPSGKHTFHNDSPTSSSHATGEQVEESPVAHRYGSRAGRFGLQQSGPGRYRLSSRFSDWGRWDFDRGRGQGPCRSCAKHSRRGPRAEQQPGLDVQGNGPHYLRQTGRQCCGEVEQVNQRRLGGPLHHLTTGGQLGYGRYTEIAGSRPGPLGPRSAAAAGAGTRWPSRARHSRTAPASSPHSGVQR